MRKIFALLFCLFSTISCTQNTPPQESKTPATEKELATARDTVKTVSFFEEYLSVFSFCPAVIPANPYNADLEHEIYLMTTELPIDKKCLVVDTFYGCETWKDNSQECVAARKTKLPETQINFFNFQKYLPENSVIKTEEEFLELVSLYRAINISENTDENLFLENTAAYNYVLSQYKIAKLNTNKNEFISNYALGMAQKCADLYPVEYNKLKQDNNYNRKILQTYFGGINLCKPDEIVNPYQEWI